MLPSLRTVYCRLQSVCPSVCLPISCTFTVWERKFTEKSTATRDTNPCNRRIIIQRQMDRSQDNINIVDLYGIAPNTFPSFSQTTSQIVYSWRDERDPIGMMGLAIINIILATPLKLRPYGALQICTLLLLLMMMMIMISPMHCGRVSLWHWLPPDRCLTGVAYYRHRQIDGWRYMRVNNPDTNPNHITKVHMQQ